MNTTTARVHLVVIGSDPVSEGPHGCDWSWNSDFTAYRCLPHRWVPGSDASYAAAVGADGFTDAERASWDRYVENFGAEVVGEDDEEDPRCSDCGTSLEERMDAGRPYFVRACDCAEREADEHGYAIADCGRERFDSGR